MIHSNELRIGNWVYNANYKNKFPTKVHGIDEIGIDPQLEFEDIHCSIGYESLLSNLEPIPLTEEILLKCGFVNIESKTVDILKFFGGGITVCYDKVDKYYYIKLHSNIELKHLHQLQNLYFALTGEELKIEL